MCLNCTLNPSLQSRHACPAADELGMQSCSSRLISPYPPYPAASAVTTQRNGETQKERKEEGVGALRGSSHLELFSRAHGRLCCLSLTTLTTLTITTCCCCCRWRCGCRELLCLGQQQTHALTCASSLECTSGWARRGEGCALQH